jgi:hypothetical protein
VVSDERAEAVLAEAMDVIDEFGVHGEVSGTVEEGLGGRTEAIVAPDDLLYRIVTESVQNP